jgi:hypothetical protein
MTRETLAFLRRQRTSNDKQRIYDRQLPLRGHQSANDQGRAQTATFDLSAAPPTMGQTYFDRGHGRATVYERSFKVSSHGRTTSDGGNWTVRQRLWY